MVAVRVTIPVEPRSPTRGQELPYKVLNFGKFVEEPEGAVVPVRDHEITRISEGLPAAVASLCLPNYLFPGQQIEQVVDPLYAPFGVLLGRLCRRADNLGYVYIVTNMRSRSERGKNAGGRVYTQAYSLIFDPEDFARLGPAWLVDRRVGPLAQGARLAALPDVIGTDKARPQLRDAKARSFDVSDGWSALTDISGATLFDAAKPLFSHLEGGDAPIPAGLDISSLVREDSAALRCTAADLAALDVRQVYQDAGLDATELRDRVDDEETAFLIRLAAFMHVLPPGYAACVSFAIGLAKPDPGFLINFIPRFTPPSAYLGGMLDNSAYMAMLEVRDDIGPESSQKWPAWAMPFGEARGPRASQVRKVFQSLATTFLPFNPNLHREDIRAYLRDPASDPDFDLVEDARNHHQEVITALHALLPDVGPLPDGFVAAYLHAAVEGRLLFQFLDQMDTGLQFNALREAIGGTHTADDGTTTFNIALDIEQCANLISMHEQVSAYLAHSPATSQALPQTLKTLESILDVSVEAHLIRAGTSVDLDQRTLAWAEKVRPNSRIMAQMRRLEKDYHAKNISLSLFTAELTPPAANLRTSYRSAIQDPLTLSAVDMLEIIAKEPQPTLAAAARERIPNMGFDQNLQPLLFLPELFAAKYFEARVEFEAYYVAPSDHVWHELARGMQLKLAERWSERGVPESVPVDMTRPAAAYQCAVGAALIAFQAAFVKAPNEREEHIERAYVFLNKRNTLPRLPAFTQFALTGKVELQDALPVDAHGLFTPQDLGLFWLGDGGDYDMDDDRDRRLLTYLIKRALEHLASDEVGQNPPPQLSLICAGLGLLVLHTRFEEYEFTERWLILMCLGLGMAKQDQIIRWLAAARDIGYLERYRAALKRAKVVDRAGIVRPASGSSMPFYLNQDMDALVVKAVGKSTSKGERLLGLLLALRIALARREGWPIYCDGKYVMSRFGKMQERNEHDINALLYECGGTDPAYPFLNGNGAFKAVMEAALDWEKRQRPA